jgi:hypothetical protein
MAILFDDESLAVQEGFTIRAESRGTVSNKPPALSKGGEEEIPPLTLRLLL